MLEKYKKLNSNAIKIIAIVAMTIDHIAWAVFPNYSVNALAIIMHIIGRVTCPIMCYFVAEGFYYTKNIKKYSFRLFIFALISHIPYMLMFGSFAEKGAIALVPFGTGFLNQTSVMWSLFIGLMMLRVAKSEKLGNFLKVDLIIILCVLALPADWSCIASLFILCIGTNRGKPLNQILWCLFYVVIYSIVYFFAFSKVYAIIQLGVILSVPSLFLYNGERGKNIKLNKFMKWFFYAYYPIHLLIIAIIVLLG